MLSDETDTRLRAHTDNLPELKQLGFEKPDK